MIYWPNLPPSGEDRPPAAWLVYLCPGWRLIRLQLGGEPFDENGVGRPDARGPCWRIRRVCPCPGCRVRVAYEAEDGDN